MGLPNRKESRGELRKGLFKAKTGPFFGMGGLSFKEGLKNPFKG